MEASALRYSGGLGLHGRSPLLRLQSDERLISLVRRGNSHAFEVLVSRYHSRLLSFCRHLLGSREDAEDVLQDVLAASYNAMIADERPINVRPWLYRIARNRCLNHLRRAQAVGVDSMDIHFSDFGASTADKVHMAEEFRMLVGDIQQLPETQRTALVLREMDALSYEQIAEAMETTVPSVKSLLVRARLSLAEAAEARMLTCEQVRIELAEVAEGLLAKASSPVRRHLRSCRRCSAFQGELKRTTKALAALMPLGPLAVLKQLAFAHIGHSASAGAGSGASSAGAAGTGVAVGSGAAAGGAFIGGGAGGMLPLGISAVATKAAAGLAAAALVTAGAVDISQRSRPVHHHVAAVPTQTTAVPVQPTHAALAAVPAAPVTHHVHQAPVHAAAPAKPKPKPASVPVKLDLAAKKATTTKPERKGAKKPDGRTQTDTVSTILTSNNSDSNATPSTTAGNQMTTSTDSTSTSSGGASVTGETTPTTTTTTPSTPTTTPTPTTPSPQSGDGTTTGTGAPPPSSSGDGSQNGSGGPTGDGSGPRDQGPVPLPAGL